MDPTKLVGGADLSVAQRVLQLPDIVAHLLERCERESRISLRIRFGDESVALTDAYLVVWRQKIEGRAYERKVDCLRRAAGGKENRQTNQKHSHLALLRVTSARLAPGNCQETA